MRINLIFFIPFLLFSTFYFRSEVAKKGEYAESFVIKKKKSKKAGRKSKERVCQKLGESSRLTVELTQSGAAFQLCVHDRIQVYLNGNDDFSKKKSDIQKLENSLEVLNDMVCKTREQYDKCTNLANQTLMINSAP